MPADLRSIGGRKPDPEVVSFLEGVLEAARAGEVTGVLVLSQELDGSLKYTIAGIKDRFTVTGWLYHAMHRLQSD